MMTFYRPQKRFTKVMFSQVSVCLQEGECLPHCMLGYTPLPPPGRYPPGRYTPDEGTPPWADTPQAGM